MDIAGKLVFLRREAGISQKKAAEDLSVSQALLSHYEKGIRQCSLQFIAAAAEYYDVSADYLLGISADKSGKRIQVSEIPDDNDLHNDNRNISNLFSTLNRKLIVNSVYMIYEVLGKAKSRKLTNDISAYLSSSVYSAFRMLYEADGENDSALFSIPKRNYRQIMLSNMMQKDAAVSDELSKMAREKKGLPLSRQSLSDEYPLFAPSLFNLILNTEKNK